jgi:hypothetical protein
VAPALTNQQQETAEACGSEPQQQQQQQQAWGAYWLVLAFALVLHEVLSAILIF